jgi:hypothetical protein
MSIRKITSGIYSVEYNEDTPNYVGTDSNYKVTDEPILEAKVIDDHFTLYKGSFYKEGLSIKRQDTDDVLVYGTDYKAKVIDPVSCKHSGKEVYTLIEMLTTINATLLVTYYYVGGTYNEQMIGVKDTLSTMSDSDRSVHYNEIKNRPSVLDAESTLHQHDAANITDKDEEVTALTEIGNQVGVAAEIGPIDESEISSASNIIEDTNVVGVGEIRMFANNLPDIIEDHHGFIWLKSGLIEDDSSLIDKNYWDKSIVNGQYIHYEVRETTTVLLRFKIAHNGTLFVAVGYDGTILTSPDGVSWVSRDNPSSSTHRLQTVIYANGLFVVSGGIGPTDPIIMTSPDGITWTEQTVPNTNSLVGLGYDGSLFVSIGNIGDIITSPDAITWTERTSPINRGLHNLSYGNGWWIGTYTSATTTDYGVIKSQDGINWVKQDIGNPEATGTLVTGYGLVDGVPTHIVGNYNDDGAVYVSNDTINWRKYRVPSSVDLFDCTFVNNIFYMTGRVGGLFTSLDGMNWYKEPVPTIEDISGIGYGLVGNRNRLVCVGDNGLILTSELENTPYIGLRAGSINKIPSFNEGTIGYCRIK